MTKHGELVGLLEEMLQNEKDMNTDERDISPHVRGAWAMRLREAQDRFSDQWGRYKEAVGTSIAAIFLTGDAAACEQFAEIAEDEGATVTIRADEMYRDLAKPLEPCLGEGSRQLMPQHVSILFDKLHDLTERLGVDITPKVHELPVLNDQEAIVGYVRDLLRSCAGDLLNSVYIVDKVARVKKEDRYTGGAIPSVVIGATKDEAIGLGSTFGLVGATITVKPGAVTKNHVLEVFRQVNKKIKESK